MNGAAANYEYVTDNARFGELCSLWSELPAIGLDTEFIRTRTFYAKVGLLQFGVESGCFVVDPLAVTDWDPCRRLLTDTQVVIHAAGEDLGLLYRLLGAAPADLFDTQLAAAFLGVGFSLGYRDLVSRFCDVELPKSETRSNWLQRPLRPSQLRYAAEDVRFLPELRDLLSSRLCAKNAQSWFAEDCRRLLAGAEFSEAPQSWWHSYRLVNDHNSLSDRGLILLRQLCFWREREIRKRDLPRNWLVGDRDLLAIARRLEHGESISADAIRSASVENRKFADRFAPELTKFLKQASSAPEPPRQNWTNAALDHVQRDMLKKCRKLVNGEADRIGVSSELLGKKKQLQQLVHSHATTGKIDWPEAMRGWRQDILAPVLAAVLPEERADAAG